jgi:hypothetical protein
MNINKPTIFEYSMLFTCVSIVDPEKKNEPTIRGLVDELNRIAIIYGLDPHELDKLLGVILTNSLSMSYHCYC